MCKHCLIAHLIENIAVCRDGLYLLRICRGAMPTLADLLIPGFPKWSLISSLRLQFGHKHFLQSVQFVQIHLLIYTNTYCSSYKFGQIHFTNTSGEIISSLPEVNTVSHST